MEGCREEERELELWWCIRCGGVPKSTLSPEPRGHMSDVQRLYSVAWEAVRGHRGNGGSGHRGARHRI